MSLAPAVLDAMLAAGCTAEQIVAAVKAESELEAQKREADLERRRVSNAERQQRFRDRRKGKRATITPSNEDNALRTATPPNDIYSNPPVSPSSANADDAPPPIEVRFVEAWNTETGLRPARKLSGQRLTKFRRRLKEFGEEAVFDGVRRLGNSPFHCGKNDREWQADIGWYLRSDDNVTKALELPEPNRPAEPVDALQTAERAAALYRRMGRDEDAAEAEKRAARLRDRSTGPPRAIGDLLPRHATAQ